MKVVVADTSPVHYLLLTGYLEILPRLYGQLVIPESVQRELLAAGSLPEVRKWMASFPDWVTVRKPVTDLKLIIK